MKLSIVLPAYNEASNIERVVDELISTIEKISLVTSYEIVVCDDHSNDYTFQLINKKAQRNNKIKSIRLSRRSGSHTALRAGIAKASGELVLCISADGQDDPVVLEKMIRKVIEEKNHTVWALRKNRNDSFFTKLFAQWFYKILRMVANKENEHIHLAHADFYLLSRKVVNAINQCKEQNTSLFGLIVWLGFKQDFVEYERRERISGKSKWNFKSRTKLAKDWIIAFSALPLKLITYVGIIAAVIGFTYAMFILVYTLLGYAKPGWAENAILILLSGGILMIMLGIIGEYLYRTLDESRNRPLYFIEDETEE